MRSSASPGSCSEVRAHLRQLAKMQYRYQREGWLLDAAAIYCDAVQSLAGHLASAQISSRGLLAFREYLAGYVASAGFTALASDTKDRKDALGQIRYCTRIRGGRVEVSRYQDEADYSAVVLKTFERFKQGAVKDYQVQLPDVAGDEPRRRPDPRAGGPAVPGGVHRPGRVLPPARRVPR